MLIIKAMLEELADTLSNEKRIRESEFPPANVITIVTDCILQTNMAIQSYLESVVGKEELARSKIVASKGWCVLDKESQLYIERKLKKLVLSGSSINDTIESDKCIAKHLMENGLFKKTCQQIKSIVSKDTDTNKKVELAFKYYEKEDYYTTALLLASIIDSVSINKDLNNNIDCHGCYGWKAFIQAFILNNKSLKKDNFNEKTTKGTAAEIFEKTHLENNVSKSLFQRYIVILSMAVFFDNVDWDKSEKLVSINRNWLCHGMYKFDDITQADCIKLFFLLYGVLYVV